LTSYPAPLGANAAYVSPAPGDGKKHPAIIWLTGGFSNSISSTAWVRGPQSNDQSAAGFRDEGIIMMYPSLRGGNKNAGNIETFYGEVDDVLAAAKFLASLEFVDPSRIYLGGHSTGGTLALLVAAASGDRFRAVFAVGPAQDAMSYGVEVLPFNTQNKKERELRAPQLWLKDIRCPTFVFEGTAQPSNLSALKTMKSRCTNPLVSFTPVPGETHFSVISPLVAKIGHSIVVDQNTSKPFSLE
jgi:dipeptidyl aminopeptidase/acylaminoacyl peptidase